MMASNYSIALVTPRDGISIIDHEDQVLLVGDSIGLPNPSIYSGVKVQDYLETLEGYRLLGLPNVISSHYNQIEDALIAASLEYLQKLLHCGIRSMQVPILP
jgi:glyoxylase-like metal-dependent hydrolase (beta-lactamase superfamily II)